MNTERYKVGIIGTGRVGVDWHVPDIREAGGEVLAFADSVPGRAAKYAAAKQVPLAFDDYRSLLAEPEVDVVAICTPPLYHREIAIAALRAGKHVYLEKPPAMDEREMADIAAVARETGKLLFTGTNSVYYNEMQWIKRQIDAGAFGTVYMVEAFKLIRRNYKQGWHLSKHLAGGGVGMDSCPHRIDLILYLLGNPAVKSVSARTYNYFVNRPKPDHVGGGYLLMDIAEGTAAGGEAADVEDTVVAFITFENGCSFLLRDMAGANMPDEWKVSLYGTKAGAALRPLMVYGETDDGHPADWKPHLPDNPKGTHVLAYRHLFDCIRMGRETQSPGERGVKVMQIIDAIYRSAASGKEVRFDG